MEDSKIANFLQMQWVILKITLRFHEYHGGPATALSTLHGTDDISMVLSPPPPDILQGVTCNVFSTGHFKGFFIGGGCSEKAH